jgi:hypothetical protein
MLINDNTLSLASLPKDQENLRPTPISNGDLEQIGSGLKVSAATPQRVVVTVWVVHNDKVAFTSSRKGIDVKSQQSPGGRPVPDQSE